MSPLVGLILIILLALLNALIAGKRRRSGWKFFLISVAPVLPMLMIVSKLSNGDSQLMAWSAFLPPVCGFIAAIACKHGLDLAAVDGSYGSFVRCPYCAEAIRRAAVKCRHCASDLPA